MPKRSMSLAGIGAFGEYERDDELATHEGWSGVIETRLFWRWRKTLAGQEIWKAATPMQTNTGTARASGDGDQALQAFDSASTQAAGKNLDTQHQALFERFSKRLKAQ